LEECGTQGCLKMGETRGIGSSCISMVGLT
jgi:hypothetical protein